MGQQKSLLDTLKEANQSEKVEPAEGIGVIAKRTHKKGWVIWGDTYGHKATYSKAGLYWHRGSSSWRSPEDMTELPTVVADTVDYWLNKADWQDVSISDAMQKRIENIASTHSMNAEAFVRALEEGALNLVHDDDLDDDMTWLTGEEAKDNVPVVELSISLDDLAQLESILGKSVKDILEQAQATSTTPTDNIGEHGLATDNLPEWFTAPSWWQQISLYIQHRPGIAIVGPAGNGKTTTAEMALQAAEMDFLSISCTDRTEVVELVGGYMLTAEGEQWKDGIVTRAFREGKAVILDEADALDPRVMMSLQNALQDAGPDGKARFVNTANGRVYPESKCPIVLCMNTFGDGGDRQYNSRNKLDAASRDRLSYIATDYENEHAILKARGVKGYYATQITEWATRIRKEIADNALPIVISPRTMLNIAQAIESFGFTFENAVEMEFWGKVPPSYRPILQPTSTGRFGA